MTTPQPAAPHPRTATSGRAAAEAAKGSRKAHNAKTAPHHPEPRLSASHSDQNYLLSAVQQRATRHARAQREGPPSLGRQVAQIGVLGWIVVLPALLGMFAGRWLDHHFGTGIFWTSPLLLLGLAAGCWAAWQWVHGR
jgi:ATP synthase protein I